MLDAVKQINDVLWNVLLLILLCGTGVYFTIRLKFIQVRKFREGIKTVFGGLRLKGEKAKNGEMSSFQSLATAIAAQVGTGNLAGAATALVSGGPGAIFWMWVSAFFGMATVYGEAVLAQQHKTERNGEITGGPVYYIRAAFRGKLGKILSAVFAVLIILALGFMGNMVQANSVGAAFASVFSARGVELNPLWIGIPLALLAVFVFVGGVSRMAAVVEKLVPVMALVYILGALALIFINIQAVPAAFLSIIKGAFAPQSVLGAAAGITVREAVRYGVARGLFSNEAGMGSTPHAHARAKVKNPHQQGVAAMISVFIDTFVILNLTAFAVLSSGVMDGSTTGIALTQKAFVSDFGGFGDIFVAVCLLFFAFSTMIGWHFFGQINIKYLFGPKAVKIYSVLVAGFIALGACLKVDLVWELADMFNGLMVIPNLLALLALSGSVAAVCRTYGSRKNPIEQSMALRKED